MTESGTAGEKDSDMYTVEVRNTVGEWTHHSEHDTYVDAIDQADMVGGRVAGINESSDAFNTGYAACEAGEDLSDNPYIETAWEYDNWIAGWQKAC